VFSLLNQRGARPSRVHHGASQQLPQVKDLQEQGRIQGLAEADFRPGKAAYLC